MNVTSTGIAVTLALVVVFGFFVLGIGNPFTSSEAMPVAATVSASPTMNNPGQMITEVQLGTGTEAKAGDTVSVQYTGTLTDGTVFDSSIPRGEPITFTLGVGQVIQGWDQGIAGMKVGGKRHLVIPPELAYGSQAVGGVIPANATLVFDVELVAVNGAN